MGTLSNRWEAFAAAALTGIMAAPRYDDMSTNQRIDHACALADRMEAAAKARLRRAAEEDGGFEIIAQTAFAHGLMYGPVRAQEEFGITYSNRDRRIVTEVVEGYGIARHAYDPHVGRCELTHIFGVDVQRYVYGPTHIWESAGNA